MFFFTAEDYSTYFYGTRIFSIHSKQTIFCLLYTHC